MGGTVNREPPVGVSLVVTDFAAHALGEYFRSPAWQRREAGVHQLAQHLLVGLPVQVGEERDLDRSEALQMDLGPDSFEAAQQLQVILERQVGMKAVDDVHFRERLIARAPAVFPRPLPSTWCRNRDRRAAGVQRNRTGSSPRRRSWLRCECCSCNTCDRRVAVRARGWPARQRPASRDARTARHRPPGTAAHRSRAFSQFPAASA